MQKVRTIYGKNKTCDQLKSQIYNTNVEANILITALDYKTFSQLPLIKDEVPDAKSLMYGSIIYPDYKFDNKQIRDECERECKASPMRIIYVKSCRCGVVLQAKKTMNFDRLSVAIASAGIADRHVAEEAGLTVYLHGYEPDFFNDIGVNDLKKTLSQLDYINKDQAVISVQGFEGALPVVLAGLTSLPIISVPTSTGYGIANKGYTALNTSLSSCTSGISAVNIDNGFGAGEVAVRILNVIEQIRNRKQDEA